MAASHPLPTFFGRFTTVLSEHEHLETILRRLDEMCSALDAGRALSAELEPARLIADLLTNLTWHFTAEEEAGYFGTVARDVPALLPRIVELKADHVAMLEEIRTLCLIAANGDPGTELGRAALHLVGRLRRHEAEENELLREYFQREGARPED